MGNTNSGDYKVLTNFLIESIKKYPAEHYAVILSDHGLGWKGAMMDDSFKSKMSIPDIRQAFEEAEKSTGVHVDILGFDACLMATGEVADELKNVADYMVASQATEHASGWPYVPLLTSRSLKSLDRTLRSRLSFSPKEFAEGMITNPGLDPKLISTLSAFDMKKMGKYEEAVNKLSETILATDTNLKTLRQIASRTQKFNSFVNGDHYHFCESIIADEGIKDQSLKEAAKNLMNVIENEIIMKNHHSKNLPNAHGITVDMPPGYGGINNPEYLKLQFAKNTKWVDAVNRFAKM
jgi:hypothetical protein